MEKLVRGVALFALGAFVVGTGYGLVQQIVKISTLQSLNNNDISVEQALLVAEGAIKECKKDKKCRREFDKLDENKDGTISFEEYKKMCAKKKKHHKKH